MNEKYDLIGQNYNATREADPFIVSRILDLLNCKKEDKILDVGCGTGNYTIALSSKLNISGLEPSELMLDEAKFKNSEIFWKQGVAENIPYENESFDAVISTLTIHHWGDLKKGFSEINRVLKPNGKFLIFTSTSEQMMNYWLNHYFQEMMKKSVEQMPSFEIISENLKNTGFQITRTEKYDIQDDLQDKFLYIGKNNPKIYFEKEIRNGISSFANLSNQEEISNGLKRLEKDLFNEKFQEITIKYIQTIGDYLFIVANKTSGFGLPTSDI